MYRKTRRPELVFKDALSAFIATEGESLLADVSERHTCGRLSLYLERQLQADGFCGYYADVEYNRKQQGQVKTIINEQLEVVQITPDIIVHTRGEKPPPHDNLIAVEVKKAARPEREKNDDRARLRAMTTTPYEGVWPWDGCHPEHVCGYAVGVFLEIDLKRRHLYLEFFKKGALTKQKQRTF
ncbi:hypothetical protein [Paraburkholderia kirstenboschensis]|uniref:Uncharacterized protein n=1 Tax=Paraburkholderia kirstenboschensis TaxID=1245436 RepID=A0ABZ0ETW4_9BURK|nr:hypothetical protein [Paraburkholderia kirstenboschensis]WOD20607.1 hypothetical protein RW095_31040 [Paraburkholderia kirstenboschensis]